MTTVDHGERTHSLLGGSNSDRWVNCYKSVFLTKDLPPQAETEATRKGTLKHELAEVLVENFLNEKLRGNSCDPIQLRPLPPPHPEWQDEIEEDAYAARDIIWEKVLKQDLQGKIWGQEMKFTIQPDIDMSGYADFWYTYIDRFGKRVAGIVDFKFGRTATSITQLIFYLCGLREELLKRGEDLDYAIGSIFQPHGVGPVYKEKRFTRKQLIDWKEKFLKAGHAIYVKKQATAKLGSWCEYCRGQTRCHKYNERLGISTQLKLIDPEDLVLPDVDSLPESHALKLAQYAEPLKKLISSAKKQVFNNLMAGKKYDEVKLVHTKTRRTWIGDTQSIIDEIEQRDVEIATKKLRALTHVEKDLKKIHGSKATSEIMERLTQQSIPSLIVVASSDPRQEVLPSDEARKLLAGDEDFDE